MKILPINDLKNNIPARKTNPAFTALYVSGFQPEPLKPNQIVELAKTIFKATSDELAKFRAGLAKVSDNELAMVRANLSAEPIGFSPEQTDKIAQHYNSESSEFLNDILTKEVKGEKKFKNPDLVVTLMSLFNKYPAQVRKVTESDINEVVVLNRVMMSLPSEAPEKAPYFKDKVDIGATIQRLIKKNYTKETAEAQVYAWYGLKPPTKP